MSDYKGAALVFDAIPDAGTNLSDKLTNNRFLSLPNQGVRPESYQEL